MTEDEAREKWCPFVRVSMGLHDRETGETPLFVGGANKAIGPSVDPARMEAGTRCLGSGCMAWRWLETHGPNPADPDGDLIRTTRTYGCCGFAGPWFANYRQGFARDSDQ